MNEFNCVVCNEAVVLESIDCMENKFFTCDDCGELHHESRCNEVEDLKYCNFCFEAKETCGDVYFCDHCRTWHHEADYPKITIYDTEETICDEGISYGDYFWCKECEQYHSTSVEEVVTCGNMAYSVCEDCATSVRDIFYCDHHERYEEGTYSITHDHNKICDDAYSDYYYCCEDCGEIYHVDDIHYPSDGDYGYCPDCIGDHIGLIKGYSHNYDIKEKYIAYEEHDITMGIELEVDNDNSHYSNNDMAERINDDLYVFKEDGSVPEGFEIVTQPFNLEYYKSEGHDILNDTLYVLRNNKFISHDAPNCGYHIHIGRKGLGYNYSHQHRTIKNIAYIMETFKSELIILSRRKLDRLNQWAKFFTGDMARSEITIPEINKYMDLSSGRYYALNLSNSSTIEFRLFRGTLNKKTFNATLEMVYNIVMYARENTITDLNDLDFMEIITYHENNYIGEYANSKLKIKSEA